MSIPQHQNPPSVVPRDIAEVFEETDMEKVWDYLEKTFHVNKKKWKANFDGEFRKSTRDVTRIELFARFGRKHFEPALNKLLCREERHPTWFLLLRFIVVDKIKRVEEERGKVAKMYGRQSGYKIHNPRY